jgi:hypothetical protein
MAMANLRTFGNALQALTLALLLTSPAHAQDWRMLNDEPFGYSVPIPSGYELTMRPEAGNSRIYHNARGDILAVWAGELEGRSFPEQVRDRRRQDEERGWNVSYERITRDWASYSGTQGDQIRYVRAIRYCGDRTAYFLIDYRRTEKERYDPIVRHMVRQMKPSAAC